MAQLRGWPGKSTRLGEVAFLCTLSGVGGCDSGQGQKRVLKGLKVPPRLKPETLCLVITALWSSP